MSTEWNMRLWPCFCGTSGVGYRRLIGEYGVNMGIPAKHHISFAILDSDVMPNGFCTHSTRSRALTALPPAAANTNPTAMSRAKTINSNIHESTSSRPDLDYTVRSRYQQRALP